MARLGIQNGPTTRGIRGDIEGLRAIAVTLVLLFHAGLPFVPAGFVGVDVFFVISGFLITGSILAELKGSGRVSLLGFYVRRARRLLPGAAVVLMAVLLLTFLFLPRIRWYDTAWDVLTSGLYVVNWRLAEQAVDYLAADTAPSVVQHFWSLSVEEQFYLVWPVLLLAIARSVRGLTHARKFERSLLLGLTLIAIPSFGWSVYLADADPGRAYFVTTTRIWELALGGGLAVLTGHLGRIPRRTAVATGWAGLAMIVASAALLRESTSFPGYAALLPTLGATALIASGVAAGRSGPAVLLDNPPLRTVGALSYSLYLWHWPLLVIAEARFGELTSTWTLAVVTFSALPAWLTYRYVENPVRFSAVFAHFPVRAAQLGVLCTLIPALCGLMFQQLVMPPTAASELLDVANPASGAETLKPSATVRLGAAILSVQPRDDPQGAPVDRVSSILPDPLSVRGDIPDPYRQGCHQNEPDSAAMSCVYGEPNASFTVALVGDSHAAQFVPTLQAIAAQRKWRLLTYTKSSCPMAAVEILKAPAGHAYPSCTEWNANVLRALTSEKRPDLVITTNSSYRVARGGTPLDYEDSSKALAAGLRTSWNAITAAGISVVVVRDTPYPGIDIADCISAHLTELTKCSVPRVRAQSGVGPIQVEAATGMKDVHMIDLNDAICPTDRCAAVIGQVIVYRDSNHLTATYARSLAPRLDAALAEFVD
jgi:peptidoglycan/LPS O-acetylase OafA/YrhL